MFCLALFPRALSLAIFATADERDWVKNSIQFLTALLKGNWTGTYGLEHPGVTTMWAGTLGLMAHYWHEVELWPEDLLSLLATLPTDIVDIHLLSTMRVPTVLLTSAEVKKDYLIPLWLEDEEGQVWGEQRERPTGGHYPTTGWSKGEVVRDQRDFLVPPRILTGEYPLMVGLLDPERDLLLGEAELGPVEAQGRVRNFEVPLIENTLEANLGGKIKLLGYKLASREIEPGGTLLLTLYWQALREMDTSYTVFVHLLDAGNKIWGQRDSMPGNGALPTTGWVAGEVIVDEYAVVIQPEAPSGEYRIEIGLYEAATGRRLDVHDEQGKTQRDSVLLDSRLWVIR